MTPDRRMAALRQAVARAGASEHYAGHLRGITASGLRDPGDLTRLPILRKEHLTTLQEAAPPFGGLMPPQGRAPHRLFVSPGPIHEPGFDDGGYWRLERAMAAAGFRPGEVIHNAFSYHLTPGGWMMDAGARALGCPVIPAGAAPVAQQVQAIARYQAGAYCGTPDFLKTLIEAYGEADLGSLPISRALLSGGPLTPGLKRLFDEAGIQAMQCYATAELGLIAYETRPGGPMRVDDDMLVEIIDPDTETAMPEAAVGEVVVTCLRMDYPLIRLATGDLSAFTDETGADGADDGAQWLRGWLGRADQTAKIRGMFVRPSQIEALTGRVPELARAQLVIRRMGERDEITLNCVLRTQREQAKDADGATTARLAEAFRAVCNLRTEVAILPDSALPKECKTIDDRR